MSNKLESLSNLKSPELYFNDLNVQKEKPMGYVSVDSLELLKQVKSDQRNLEARGIKTLWVRPGETRLFSDPVLYVWDEKSLQDLLTRNKQTLDSAGWPSMPEEFVRKVIQAYAPSGTALFDLIADAFGDKTNRMRSNLTVPSMHKEEYFAQQENILEEHLSEDERAFADYCRVRFSTGQNLARALDLQVEEGSISNGERFTRMDEYYATDQQIYSDLISKLDPQRYMAIERAIIRERKQNTG